MRISDWSSDVCSSDPGEHRSSGQYVLPVTLTGSANDNVFRRFRMIGLLRLSCIVLRQSRGEKKPGGGAGEQGGTEEACQSNLNAWDCADLKFNDHSYQYVLGLFEFTHQSLFPQHTHTTLRPPLPPQHH